MAAFDIYEVPVGRGVLALSPMPAGVDALTAWRPDMVVSMTEDHEFGAGFASALRTSEFAWRQVAIEDFGVPTDPNAWPPVEADILAVLANGGRVLIHCMGGCGRSGMAVLRCMIALGEDADAALLRLRFIRPCAVETRAQLDWAQRS